jgi:hypothetical protein
MLIALADVLRCGKPVDLIVNGRRRKVWLLFVGNCRYAPSGAAPAYRPDLADGTLDVRMVDGSQPLARTRWSLRCCSARSAGAASTRPGRPPRCMSRAWGRLGAAVPRWRGDGDEAGAQDRTAFLFHDGRMGNTHADRAQAQLRVGVYARLSETYDAAKSVTTQVDRGTAHAQRRGWAVAASFKDDGSLGGFR